MNYDADPRDWTEGVLADLESAEDDGAERRLEVLESLNEKLEEELELDRPRTRPDDEPSPGGEAGPPGR